MARISDSELERLKVEVSLVALVQAKGVALKKHGADMVGRCPFHDDQGPSFVVSVSKNLWRCHGACQVGGSVVDFVMRAEGVSFRHAVELLRSGAPITDGPVVRASSVPRLPSPLDHDAEDRVLLGQVVGFYADALAGSADAMGFLERRKISTEAAGVFRLGFADRTLGYRLPETNRKAGAELRGRLQRLGVIRPSGHELFRGSLVVPVFDAVGDVAEVYGRKINDRLREGTPKHLYLPGPHRGVWNADAIEAGGEVVVCESLIDALTFWSAGIMNVTAAYGVEGFTPDHWALFEKRCVGRVLLAFDADPAGDKAAQKLSALMIERLGVEVFRVEFPPGCDVNDVAVATDDPAVVLSGLVRSATWIGGGVSAARAAKQEGPSKVVEPEASSFAAEPSPAVVSPVPPVPVDAKVSINAEHELVAVFGARRWRVRGLAKVSSFDMLRVNVLVAKTTSDMRADDRFHVDTLDLYSARARAVFTKTAADELALEEDVIGQCA